MDWLLVVWVGTFLHGGPAMERFATRDDCEMAAKVVGEVSEHRIIKWRCVQIERVRS